MNLAHVPAAWIAASRRRPRLVLAAAAVLAFASVLHARGNLGLDTDTAGMISADPEWRQTWIEFKEAFPQLVDTLLIVVDGETPDLADRASRDLAAALEAEHTLVEWAMRPDALPFFERNALLYLTPGELDALSSRLAEVQPFLGTLATEPDLAGFAKLLERASAASGPDRSRVDLAPALDAIADAADAERDGRFFEVSWRNLLAGDAGPEPATRRFVAVKPRLDYRELLPAGPVIERVRSLAHALGLTAGNGVRVRVTGGPALEHEELESVTQGAGIAGVVALAMVSVVLIAGLGSWRLVLATLGTLLVGLACTAGFATAAIGSLNLISVAFAVLYIGLGVDYAIHLSLRYRELVRRGAAHGEALDTAAGDTGASLVLCAVTTGLAFYAFVPTEFAGVSELGIISGTGMFVSLAATLTVLPAILTLIPLPPRRGVPGTAPRRDARHAPGTPPSGGTRPAPDTSLSGGTRPASHTPLSGDARPAPDISLSGDIRCIPDMSPSGDVRHIPAASPSGGASPPAWMSKWASVPGRFRAPVIAVATVLGLGALAAVPVARFDDNPLNLRDPAAESVIAYRDLLAAGDPSPWTLSVLRSGFADAERLARRLEALDSVKEVRWAASFVPEAQPEKLDRIEDLALILGPDLDLAAPAPDPGTDGRRAGFERLHRAVGALAADAASPPAAPRAGSSGPDPAHRLRADAASPRAASRARSALDALAAGIDDAAIRSFERRLTGGLPDRIDLLSRSLDAEEVTIESFPPRLHEQWIAGDGRYRLEIHPSENLDLRPALVRFIDDVQGIAPAATGTPLVQLKSGESVAGAFVQALGCALVLVTAALVLVSRPRRDALLVMCPLLFAGALTVAAMVVLGIPFNFANVIALPLLLGIGVDNGIHMVRRARAAAGPGGVLATSTARAVLTSALTTICGFGSLAFSPHPGMASMGAVLTIGLVATLVCTLLVLPAFMTPASQETAW